MQTVYPLLEEADVIFLASPIFFYSVTAQVKALIDRAQADWAKNQLDRSSEEKMLKRGRGYLISAGATRGKNLFEGAQMVARYFFDALNMSYEGGIFFRSIEKRTAVRDNPDTLREAFNLGIKAVAS
jgi:multimeric flavodoxin WrbA